jgi:uncharacterized protein involved in response to NO
MGFFGSLLIAMVTRVTVGHSGRPLQMDRVALACFLGVQIATVARVTSEVLSAPAAMRLFLLASLALWLIAITVWSGRMLRIYVRPRIDGKPG